MTTPYTITYGPWAPDLQDVGVQLDPRQTAVTLPAADCQNVFYQDGAYRCLPSPQSIGPSLGVPITNAVNWYDDSTGKEEIFAATANGLYVLVDGTWSAVPIQSSTSAVAVGSVLTLTLGTPVYRSISATQSANTATSSGAPTTQTTTSVTVTPTGTGTSFSYSWALLGGTSPVFSIANPTAATSNFVASGMSHGNTYTGSAQCTVTDNDGLVAVLPAVSLECICYAAPPVYTGTLVAGHTSSGILVDGFSVPFAVGSLTPSSDAHSHPIITLAYISSLSGNGLFLELDGFSSDPGATYFSTLKVNSTSYAQASAFYSYSGGAATWQWTVGDIFTPGSSYSIEIDY